MDNFQKTKRRLQVFSFIILLTENCLLVALWWLSSHPAKPQTLFFIGSVLLAIVSSFVLSLIIANYALQPVQAIWKGILHLSPTDHGIQAPKIDHLTLGRQLVESLMFQVYQLNDVAQRNALTAAEERKDISHNFIAENLPLPLFILDSSETIKFANQAAVNYIGIAAKDLIGKNVYMVLDMSFPSENTFDSWLKTVKTDKATATKSWERVRLNVRDNHPTRLFDLAAYYNRDNPDGVETLLALFDHTKQYSQDDQAISFIALSVHELRTPLTLLRGYIEVFEDELNGKVDPELQDFMQKMASQAQQLMAFVNNILNVARIDDDQLGLKLEEADWPSVLKSAIQSLSLQAKVRGISLHCRLAKDLPSVGIDRISIQEVINNLVDNAIKYSGDSKVINIDSRLSKDGLVETTVQDFGLGISSSIIPNLFTKFYRDHHNRAQIGGTGLGLYLSKAIVTAHGGNIWVRSKPGEGSSFSFTLIPYSQLADDAKHNGNQELVRGAHGWIKNHSLYRR